MSAAATPAQGPAGPDPTAPVVRGARARDAGAVGGTLLADWHAGVQRGPELPHVHHGEAVLTRADVERRSVVLARAWRSSGVRHGDRVAIQLQNVPTMVDAVLAAWRIGAVVVPLNPMYRCREVEHVLTDSGAVLLVHDGTADTGAADAAVEARVRDVVTAEQLDRLVATAESLDEQESPDRPIGAGDLALLTYTSGTTGPPKGATATHANVAAGAAVYRDHAGVGEGSVVLAVAPLCHVTGMIGHLAVALAAPAELVLMGRFDADTALDLVETKRVTFTIGAITAYRALLSAAERRPRALGSVRSLYSGGAPVAPAVAREVERVFGVPLGNAYGLTETTSTSHLTPLGEHAPVHAETGALSIGRPVPGTRAWVVDEDGRRLGAEQAGELVIDGHGVVPGYWRNEEATASSFVDGALRTGDVAIVDADGWTYLVDRIKDQINASGFKVWPREVEDSLHEHPAVAEAAVFGVGDEYRGETVVAAVVLRAGATAGAEELIGFTRERLAPYKCPRRIRLVDDLPTTASGKLLRRELRESEESADA